jgi:hypothetical protein
MSSVHQSDRLCKVSIPAWGVDVTLAPVVYECEFDATPTTRDYYWEGEGIVGGSQSNKGFVELTFLDLKSNIDTGLLLGGGGQVKTTVQDT